MRRELVGLEHFIGISMIWVKRIYLDLLEKVLVVFRLTGFSRNRRKEVTKSNRFYFYDIGIRNAIVGMFNPVMLLPQSGRLLEAPWKGAGLSSHQLKSEIQRWDTDLRRSSQIN